jgi:hypothetical protein
MSNLKYFLTKNINQFKMNKNFLFSGMLLICGASLYAQTGNVGIGTTVPHHILDLDATIGSTTIDSVWQKTCRL